MEQKDNIEIEHIIANSKTIEKLELRIGKMEEKEIALELIISKWTNYFLGMAAVIVGCCCVLGWGIQRGIDNNDHMNDVQNAEINQIKIQVMQTRENMNMLQRVGNKLISIDSERTMN
jgi:hypothetical protein